MVKNNRLYDLVSEDRAIDDVLYHFGASYSSEKMDLGVYLKVNDCFI
jgi:hypothetical protein